jgi:hypothetical protein
MTGPSCRRTVLAVVVLLAALVAVGSPAVALAQAPAGQIGQAPPVTRTEARDDDDSGNGASSASWGSSAWLASDAAIQRDRSPWPIDPSVDRRSFIPPCLPTSSLTCGVSVTNGRLDAAWASSPRHAPLASRRCCRGLWERAACRGIYRGTHAASRTGSRGTGVSIESPRVGITCSSPEDGR